MLGLKRNEVVLREHQVEWEEEAKNIADKLKAVFGNLAIDIQHIGSTAIGNIKAKPMLDIVLAIRSFGDLSDDVFLRLSDIGVYKSSTQPLFGIILCAIKAHRDSDIVLANLHIVEIGSSEFNNHIAFRDYMNACPEKAKEYEKIKMELASKFPNDREAYTIGKNSFIKAMLIEAKQFFSDVL